MSETKKFAAVVAIVVALVMAAGLAAPVAAIDHDDFDEWLFSIFMCGGGGGVGGGGPTCRSCQPWAGADYHCANVDAVSHIGHTPCVNTITYNEWGCFFGGDYQGSPTCTYSK